MHNVFGTQVAQDQIGRLGRITYSHEEQWNAGTSSSASVMMAKKAIRRFDRRASIISLRRSGIKPGKANADSRISVAMRDRLYKDVLQAPSR